MCALQDTMQTSLHRREQSLDHHAIWLMLYCRFSAVFQQAVYAQQVTLSEVLDQWQ